MYSYIPHVLSSQADARNNRRTERFQQTPSQPIPVMSRSSETRRGAPPTSGMTVYYAQEQKRAFPFARYDVSTENRIRRIRDEDERAQLQQAVQYMRHRPASGPVIHSGEYELNQETRMRGQKIV